MNTIAIVTLPSLIQQCQAGDARAIEELVVTHTPAVYRLALSLLADPLEADEATQDALLHALAALKTFRGNSAFTTWLYAITLNVCRSRLRQRRVRARLTQTLQAVFRRPPPPEDLALQNVANDAVWQAIQTLTDPLREPILLRYYHDLPIADIARVVGVSERTIHTRLSAAHERLRVLLGRQQMFDQG